MSYIVPSVLVYQQLASNAGVANITPDLDTCILGPCYNVLTYVAGSSTSLTATAALTSTDTPASISNNAISNTVYLGSRKPGQIVDPATVVMYLNAAAVETKVGHMTGVAGSNVVTFAVFSGTGTATSTSAVITAVTNVTELNVGDIVTVAGAGPAAAALTSTILSISGTSVTLSDTASTSGSSLAITRTSFNNLNAASSTLRVESGDSVLISYGSSSTFVTTVLSVTGTNNVITAINTTDVLPVGVSVPLTLSVRKTYNNLVLPVTYSGHTNYSASNVTVDASIVINPLPVVSYGTIVTGSVHIAYKALRTDLFGSVLDIDNIEDQVGVLGEATDQNPLALGVNLALANTIGRIRAVAIQSNDLTGYVAGLELLENERVYALVPLTQDASILAAVQQHVEQMSTPENASWRIALVNTEISAVSYIGPYNPNLVNANGGNNSVALVSSNYVLTASNAQFVTDGVVPGDLIKITSHAVTSQVITSLTVSNVISNQQVIVNSPIALTAVNYYVQRNLTRTQQASNVAAMSESFGSHRVTHIQPDSVGVTIAGTVTYLPGYYLCAAISGLISGLPAQQSLTNIGIAGISDLQHSNRYFTRAQLSTISAAGTWLVVQEAQGTIPYTRHSLTTDMTVLQYREIQQVKNIDYLSYFFHDILKGFPGKYNITNDTLQILRTTIIAGGKLLQGKSLPKIGAPLLDFQINTLKQDPNNKDQVIVEMPVMMPTVMNYINLYLIY